MIKNVFKYVIKGLIYSVIFAVIGGIFSLVKGWEILKGAYISVLGAGLVAIIVSVVLLVGTPKMRKEYFVRSTKEDFKDPIRGGEGLGPALMAIVMIIIGFALEALMH